MAVALLTLMVTDASRANDAAASVPEQRRRFCHDGSTVLLTCYVRHPSGMWTRDELQANGTWLHLGTVVTPPAQLG